MYETITKTQIRPNTGHLAEQYVEDQRIGEFREALLNAGVSPITATVDLTTPRPAEDAREKFFGTDLRMEPTLYAVPEIADTLAGNLQGFEPFTSRGGKASGHGVFFGALTFSDGSELRVAVKPHRGNGEGDIVSSRQAERSCLNDYFTNVAAKEGGFESLEPVGFILDTKGDQYSLTVLDESLKTFDGTNWTRFYEPGFETTGMQELWYKAALLAAQLHDHGDAKHKQHTNSYHGDLAARNIATNPSGQVFLIDWEYGNVTNAPATDIEERFGHSLVDLNKLMESMARPTTVSNPGIGLFTQCQGSWWEGFKEIFLDDYMEFRRSLAAQGSHHTRRYKEVEAELAQLEHTLEERMHRYQAFAEQQA